MTEGRLEIPAEAVEAALSAFEANRVKPTELAIADALEAAYPHLLAVFAKQLEAMVESRELNSHDCGWVVPTTDLESFLERLEDTSEGTD